MIPSCLRIVKNSSRFFIPIRLHKSCFSTLSRPTNLVIQASRTSLISIHVGRRLQSNDTQKIGSPGVNVSVSANGRIVQCAFADFTTGFHSVWLRHNCQCPLCLQEHSGQRLLDFTTIPSSVSVKSATVRDGCLHLLWNEEPDHQTRINVAWLSENNYGWKERPRRTWETNKTVPELEYTRLLSSSSAISELLDSLVHQGLCLVRQVPTNDQHVADVARLIAPVQNTLYGEVFDVVATPQPINVAYSQAGLDFHMDLAYYESPPGLLLLHCIHNDPVVNGGQSLFVDILAAAEDLRRRYPKEFELLCSIPATFQKIHYERDWPVHMRYQRPHIQLNHRQEVVAATWAPAFEGPLLVDHEFVEPFFAAYRQFNLLLKEPGRLVEFRLQPGDLIVFNNRRMLHGRRSFELNGGRRHLQGCYIHIDEFKSRVAIMQKEKGRKIELPPVGNQCWS